MKKIIGFDLDGTLTQHKTPLGGESRRMLDELIYIGDDFGEGGNDSQVRNGGIDVVEIDDSRRFSERVECLLNA